VDTTEVAPGADTIEEGTIEVEGTTTEGTTEDHISDLGIITIGEVND